MHYTKLTYTLLYFNDDQKSGCGGEVHHASIFLRGLGLGLGLGLIDRSVYDHEFVIAF